MKDRFKRSVATLTMAAALFSASFAGIIPVASASTDLCTNYNAAPGTDLCNAIQYLSSRGIMSVYNSGTSNDNFNRAESLTVVLRAFDAGVDANVNTINPPSGQQLGFIDTPAGTAQWWYGYVLRGKQLGAISGYADGTFRASNYVTRAEFVKMFLAMSGYKNNPLNMNLYSTTGGGQYATGDIYANRDQWYAKYFAYIKSKPPMENAFHNTACAGYENFCPNLYITRNEAALFMYYFTKATNSNLLNPNGVNPTPSPSPTTLGTPVLSFPVNNQVYTNTQNQTVNFTWSAVPGATSYNLMIRVPQSTSYFVNQNTSTNTSSYYFNVLNSNQGYYWKVRAFDNNGNTKDSVENYLSFGSTTTSQSISSKTPANYATVNYGTTVDFQWQDSGIPSGGLHGVQMSCSNSSFPTVDHWLEWDTTSNNEFFLPASSFTSANTSGFNFSSNIYCKWRVAYYATSGNPNSLSATSETRYITFNVSSTPAATLGTAVLTSPVTNSSFYNGNQAFTFYWNPAANATRYDLMVRYGGSSTYTTYPMGNVTSYYAPASFFPQLNSNSSYYIANWKIRAYNANNNYVDSAESNFTVYSASSSQLGTAVPTFPTSGYNYTYGASGLTFTWNPATNAHKYDLMVRWGGASNYSVYSMDGGTSQYIMPGTNFPAPAANGYQTHWKVRSYDSLGNSTDSAEWMFYVNP